LYYYDNQADYDDYVEAHKEMTRQRVIQMYREQYAREQAEGIVVIPVRTSIDIYRARAVFPPLPVREDVPVTN
jgi:hypothetical protein